MVFNGRYSEERDLIFNIDQVTVDKSLDGYILFAFLDVFKQGIYRQLADFLRTLGNDI